MKKFLLSALMFAGFVACSTDSELNETVAPDVKSSFKVFASQESFDATRVSIELDGQDRRTVLKWEDSDKIKLSAQKNAAVGNLEMSITEISADRKNATFQANSSILPVEDDLYYACYQANGWAKLIEEEIEDEKHYGVYYTVPATQSGLAKDAIVLYATGKEAEGEGGIPMQFSAVNSILYVTVNDAPAAGFSELTLTDFNGKYISGDVFHYGANESNFDSLQGTSITIQGSEANGYLTNAIYIMLPGNLDLETGYTLSFTTRDSEPKKMSFGFNAAEKLDPATIYGAVVDWTTPTVTLGAKTSYSYGVGTNGVTKNATKANGMDGQTIYFDTDYRSSYTGVQNAMVVAAGFIVDGAEKTATIDKTNKQFYMANLTGQSKANHSVKAFIDVKFIDVKYGNTTVRYYSDEETLAVTGIPYSVSSFSSLPADWSWDNARIWQNRIKLLQSNSYFITQSSFVPKSFNVDISLDAYGYGGTLPNRYNPNIYISESETGSLSGTAIKITNKSGVYPNQASFTKYGKTITLSNSGKICVYAQGSGSGASIAAEGGHGVCVEDFSVKYAE